MTNEINPRKMVLSFILKNKTIQTPKAPKRLTHVALVYEKTIAAVSAITTNHERNFMSEEQVERNAKPKITGNNNASTAPYDVWSL